jgi:hypothetical protein
MTTINSFVKRLKKIGVNITLLGNYPWVYLHTINGKQVQGTYKAEHGFTVFFIGVKPGQPLKMTDTSVIFKKIRETLK